MSALEYGLEQLLQGRPKDALVAFENCEPSPASEKLLMLARLLADLSVYTAELAKGNLSTQPPGPENRLATDLKSLHAKLRRLARQLLMHSTGYPMPAVDYLGDLSERLNFLISQAGERQKLLRYDQDYDAETGLLNRKAFIRRVYDFMRTQPGRVGVLFCLGLDNLKYINDTHGYEAGDLYIGKVVEVLRSCERPAGLVARLGGDEFAVYAHGFEGEDDAFRYARDSFKILFNTRLELPGEAVKLRASCGVSVYPHDSTASDVLMSYASHAMFEAQSLSRGTIMRFSPEVYRAKFRLLSRQERLEELIESRGINFAFQPVIRLHDAATVGYEALMRPLTDDFKGPLDILSLAESLSKLRQLEKVTFQVIFDWIFANLPRLGERRIFFNTVSTHYLDIDRLRKIHPQYARISKNLVFEILETASAENELLEKVNTLRRELSALIAIDDFGCGHSNALRLMSISPDILKIDRFFISNIHNAPGSKQEFLSNILTYCRAKGIQSLAEGVETREELASVARMGFDYAQGFYLGRPDFQLNELEPRIAAEIAEALRNA